MWANMIFRAILNLVGQCQQAFLCKLTEYTLQRYVHFCSAWAYHFRFGVQLASALFYRKATFHSMKKVALNKCNFALTPPR